MSNRARSRCWADGGRRGRIVGAVGGVRALAALAVLAVVSCGGSGDDRTPADGDSGTPGGQWEATLGGHELDIEGAGVTCEPSEDSMRLRIGDIDPDNPSRGTGILAVVGTPRTEPHVLLVDMSLPDGRTLLFSPLSGSGPGTPAPEARVDGDTYELAGAARVHTLDGDSATTAFEITVTCA